METKVKKAFMNIFVMGFFLFFLFFYVPLSDEFCLVDFFSASISWDFLPYLRY